MTKTTKASGVQKAISDDIVQGKRAPGSALDETVLAREFGVSRTPIREAIRQLEASGLVEARPHRGAVVCAVPADRVADMLVVLVELETLCARLSATAMTERQRAALRALQDGAAALARRPLAVLAIGSALATATLIGPFRAPPLRGLGHAPGDHVGELEAVFFVGEQVFRVA